MSWRPVTNTKYRYKQKNIMRNKIFETRAGEIEKELNEQRKPQPGPRTIFERDYLDNPKYKSLEEAIEKYLEEQDSNHIYTKDMIEAWAEEILAKRKQRDDDDAR